VEGGEWPAAGVVSVEDMITTGGAVADAVAAAAPGGRGLIAVLLAVVCAIWRGEGAPSIGAMAGRSVRPAPTEAHLGAA
jgi:orotate phosphoribosyltransferase